jgi:hypothetical protein
MKLGNNFVQSQENMQAAEGTARFKSSSQVKLSETTSFSVDLVALSNGAGMVLQNLSLNTEAREARIDSLAKSFASGKLHVNVANLASTLLQRGFDSEGL